jgi:hypothetical protein
VNQARHTGLFYAGIAAIFGLLDHTVRRHQGEQFICRWRVESIGDDDALFTLGRDLQNGRQLPRIASRIGFRCL